MRTADGRLSEEAIALLNAAAIENPHELYPLSSLAADLGRAKLLEIRLSVGEDPRPVSRIMKKQRWRVFITDLGWDHVTAPEALVLKNRRIALRRLNGKDRYL